MLARSHRMLLKIDLSERVSKFPRIVYMPRRVGYWGTYTAYKCSILYITCILCLFLVPWKYAINRNGIILLQWLFLKLSHSPSLRARYTTLSEGKMKKIW